VKIYFVTISKIAGKELKKLPAKEVKKIFPKIKSLSINPRPEGCKKLKGESESLCRIRVGDYRIIYIIDDLIEIVGIRRIAPQRDIYQ